MTKVKRYDIIQKLLNENLQKEVFGQVKKVFKKNLKKYLTNNKMYDIMNKLLRDSENELNIEN